MSKQRAREGRKEPVFPWPVIAFLALTTLLHFVLAFRFPLAPDETYYWEWSRRLDWGYYDQGPAIAWAIRASCLLFGENEIGIRMTAVLATLVGQVFLYLLSRDLFGPRVAFLSLWPLAFTPLALAGGFLATYDPLVVMFWSIALYFASRALFFGSRMAWLALGIALGLGALSKYTMFLFVPCLALFLVTAPTHRRWFSRAGPGLMLTLGALILAPNLWWLSQHDWITVTHIDQLTSSRADRPVLERIGSYVGTQAALITPVVFALAIISLVWAARRRNEFEERRWLLFCFSAPILVLFFLETFRGSVLANWPILGWLTVPTAIAAWIESSRHNTEILRKRTLTFALSIVFAAFVSLMIVFPEALAAIGFRVPMGWSRQVNRLWGGVELGRAADRIKTEMETETGGKVAVAGTHYDTSGRLAFYMSGKPETLCLFLGTRLNQYIYWNPAIAPPEGGAMLIVGDYAHDSPKRPPYEQVFDRVEPVEDPVLVFRRPLYDEPVKSYYLYRCYGFRPDPSAISPRIGD